MLLSGIKKEARESKAAKCETNISSKIPRTYFSSQTKYIEFPVVIFFFYIDIGKESKLTFEQQNANREELCLVIQRAKRKLMIVCDHRIVRFLEVFLGAGVVEILVKEEVCNFDKILQIMYLFMYNVMIYKLENSWNLSTKNSFIIFFILLILYYIIYY